MFHLLRLLIIAEPITGALPRERALSNDLFQKLCVGDLSELPGCALSTRVMLRKN